MSTTNPTPAAKRAIYEVRAVWIAGEHCEHFVSQPTELFDRRPMLKRTPDKFGVYTYGGAPVEDHETRAEAETHAGQLNGVA